MGSISMEVAAPLQDFRLLRHPVPPCPARHNGAFFKAPVARGEAAKLGIGTRLGPAQPKTQLVAVPNQWTSAHPKVGSHHRARKQSLGGNALIIAPNFIPHTFQRITSQTT